MTQGTQATPWFKTSKGDQSVGKAFSLLRGRISGVEEGTNWGQVESFYKNHVVLFVRRELVKPRRAGGQDVGDGH